MMEKAQNIMGTMFGVPDFLTKLLMPAIAVGQEKHADATNAENNAFSSFRINLKKKGIWLTRISLIASTTLLFILKTGMNY